MIRINQIKIPIFEAEKGEEEILQKKAAKLLRVPPDSFRKLIVRRRSVDARDKQCIFFAYLLDVKLRDSITGPNADTESAFVKKLRNPNITVETAVPYKPPILSEDMRKAVLTSPPALHPIVAGAGPCGLFAALILCRAGLKPLILERGERMEKRRETVTRFWETGKLNTESNVQFGEGGAGTFSDGKLNTSVKGQQSLIRFVLETFCQYGAPKEILTDQKPHIGTDILSDVIVSMRKEILSLGGRFLFETKLLDLVTENGVLKAVRVEPPRSYEEKKVFLQTCRDFFAQGEASAVTMAAGEHGNCLIPCSGLILALGHSARDTLERLFADGLSMAQKPFAMGIRVQHPQELIDRALYGEDRLERKVRLLGPASYKLTHRCQNGRSVYSFCMCPGGYVVNSSSEEGRLCVNGMSDYARDSGCANAALIVNVTTDDFPSAHPLAGVCLQRELEEKAYRLAGGAVPAETLGDFQRGEAAPHSELGISWMPQFKGYYASAPLHSILPPFMREALSEGLRAFDRIIPGYASDEAILAGIEARTSSPVRIPREGASFQSNIRGVFPAGEGAGYAGGITSAAADGIRAAEHLIASYGKQSNQACCLSQRDQKSEG